MPPPDVNIAINMIQRAKGVLSRAVNMPSKQTMLAAYAAVRAIRDSLPQAVVNYPWGYRATAILQQMEFQLQQYERTYQPAPGTSTVMPPPLIPGGQPFGPQTPIQIFAGHGRTARAFGITSNVIPQLHMVQQLLRRGEVQARAASLGTRLQPPIVALQGTQRRLRALRPRALGSLSLQAQGSEAKSIQLVDAMRDAEDKLPEGHPARAQLSRARADFLHPKPRALTTTAAQSDTSPLPQRLLEAGGKGVLIWSGLRLFNVDAKKAAFIGVVGGLAIEFIGLEEALKQGVLRLVRDAAGMFS